MKIYRHKGFTIAPVVRNIECKNTVTMTSFVMHRPTKQFTVKGIGSDSSRQHRSLEAAKSYVDWLVGLRRYDRSGRRMREPGIARA